MKTLAILAVTTLACIAGCAAPSSSSSNSDAVAGDDQDITAAQKPLIGTFDASAKGSHDATVFSHFEFAQAGTYVARGGCPQNNNTVIHCFAISQQTGKWTAVNGELTLTSSSGDKSKYDYTLKADKLIIKSGTKSAGFDKSDSPRKLRTAQICADADNNTLGTCPDDLECLDDGEAQRCLPPI